MGNEAAFNVDFKEKIRATVIEATMNLFTKEQMDEMVNKEIKAFFESETEDVGTRVNPWRKLVWDNIYAYMKPKIEKVFIEENSQIKNEVDEWFLAQIVPNLKAGNKALFSQIAMTSSITLQQKLMKQSADAAYITLTNTLRASGMDYNIVNNIPYIDFSANPIIVEQPKT